MALFPACAFDVVLPKGGVVAGERLAGELVLDLPAPVPRAQEIQLVFRSTATAHDGGDNNNAAFEELFFRSFVIPLPREGTLAKGRHRYAFEIDIPEWLPPACEGADWAIRHTIDARLDVDWAIDPKATVLPNVVMPPVDGTAEPTSTRSGSDFHASMVVEITLDSAVVAQGQPVTGQIALRSGRDARFASIAVALTGLATIKMGRGDRRNGASAVVRIPASRLVTGESTRFSLASSDIPPTFRNEHIHHDVVVSVTVEVPLGFDSSFEVPVVVLPRGSKVRPSASGAAPVGTARVRQLASLMAEATGLRVAEAPTLLEGIAGPVSFRIVDGPRGGNLGLDVTLSFPSLELGLVFRPRGALEGFRSSPLLPASMSDRYLFRLAPETGRPALPDEAIAELLGVLVGDLDRANDVKLDDQRLAYHLPIESDDPDAMRKVALLVRAKADRVEAAIAALPLPAALATARSAWVATGTEHGARLVPSGPSLHELTLRSRVLGGELRTMSATIRTIWSADGEPSIEVDVRLVDAPLPKATRAELDATPDLPGLRGVREVLPELSFTSPTAAILATSSWTPDPRALIAPLESFFAWVLTARGERRADAPYR